MKTLIVIVSVLAITTTVYGTNPERLRRFMNNLRQFSEAIDGPGAEPSGEALARTAEKDGQLLNANREYIREASLQGLKDAISDPKDLKKSEEIYSKCHNDVVQSGVIGWEQTVKIATCILPILPMFDQLE